MKTLKMAKYQAVRVISSAKIYYAIFLAVVTFIAIVNVKYSGNVRSSGMELATVIFLFITGLNSFTENFKFASANSLSRSTFFNGVVIGILPVAFLMSIADLVINRIYNLFVLCPTNYDMLYTSYRDTGMFDWNTFNFVWSQSNEAGILFGTAIWQFALYTTVFLIGLFITLVYYRSSKPVKFIVSAVPILLLMLSGFIFDLFPEEFWASLNSFIGYIFGWQSRNPYMAVVTFFILSMFFVYFAYLLTKKAVIKK